MKKQNILLNFLILIIFAICIVTSGCKEVKSSQSGEEEKIFVMSGAGLKTVLDPFGEAFTKETGIKVEYSYLCSAMLLSNLQLTRQGDVFIPGSQYYMDLAVNKGVVDPNTVNNKVAYMIPCIMVQKGNPKNITSLEDLTRPGISVGVGEPDALAVGRLTVKLLKKNGLYEEVMKNVQLTGGSATKLAIPVVMKNLDAVINWLPIGLLFAHECEIIRLPEDQILYSVAPMGIASYSNKKEAAKKYLDFAYSEEARTLFKKFGYWPYFDVAEIEKVR